MGEHDDSQTIVMPRSPLQQASREQDPTGQEVPSQEAPFQDPPSGPLLKDIGPYRLIRSLGRGGMGEVFLARQTAPIERDVAIKLLHGSMRGQAALRFELERKTLARMNHPCIAQVYEAGDTEDGHPFLAMEFVEGTAIDAYCNLRRLPLRTRLELFCAVCDGIHHAHQKGVLHRDIKPDNVLVAEIQGRPQPKIIDFGIAKSFHGEDAQLTQAGGVVGTPAYLSPEAISGTGDLDIRADVYALGIMLFGLLVDALPFEEPGESWLDLIRTIVDEDAPPLTRRLASLEPGRQDTIAKARGLPSGAALAKALRGDLEAIVAKAVDRHRDQRYNSAADLAADIRRFLDDQPVVARAAGRWYETRKFVRRHRRGVAVASLLVLTLVAGIVARTFEARRADRAAIAAIEAQRETEQVVEFLVDLFEVVDPGRSLGETVTARELLDQGAARVNRELEEQPRVRGRLLDTIGVVYDQLGLHAEAGELLEEALALRRGLVPSQPLLVAETLVHLGEVRSNALQIEEAKALYGEALEIRRRELGPEHPEVAAVLDALGMAHVIEADFPEAERLLGEALALREAHFGAGSIEVAETLNHLAIAKNDQGHWPEAEQLMRRVLSIRETVYGTEHPEVSHALNLLGITMGAQDRHGEAEAILRRSLRIREKVFGEEHTFVAQSYNNLSTQLYALGRMEKSREALEKALGIWTNIFGENHPKTQTAIYNLGDYYFEMGDLERAGTMLRKSLDIGTQGQGPDHPVVAFALKRLGDLAHLEDRLDEGEDFYRRAFEIRVTKLGPDHPHVGFTARALAALLRDKGDIQAAINLETKYPDPDAVEEPKDEDTESTDTGLLFPQ